MNSRARAGAVALAGIGLLLSALQGAQAGVNQPLGKGNAGIGGWRLASVGGLTARLRPVPGALTVTFTKQGSERRFLALETRLQAVPANARALVVRYRLDLKQGQAPRLGLVVFEKGGGAWYRAGTETVLAQPATGRLPITGLRPAAFSEGRSQALKWARAEKVWFGLVFDGPAAGTLSLRQIAFTDEPYRPDRPIRVTGSGAGQWTVSKDPAVEATMATGNEGPEGQPCTRLEFRFPGGRHMYLTPSVPVPAADLEGYTALRFRYRATLPEGVKGLLVTLSERGGGQWYVEPPASPEWTTIRLPFTQFANADWGKDPDGKLDIEQIAGLIIGTHGTATGEGGSGQIQVCDIEFVP